MLTLLIGRMPMHRILMLQRCNSNDFMAAWIDKFSIENGAKANHKACESK